MSEQVVIPGALPAPPTPSPLAPARLRDLLLRPAAFFTSPALLKKPELPIAAWIVGVATAIERMELRHSVAEVVRAGGVSQAMAHGSWPVFWTLAIVAGAIQGALVWWIGGWWYRVRLELCGANNPDPRRARAVYTYQNIVADVPTLLTAVVYTFVYTNYAAAFDTIEWWSAFALVFVVWSYFTSYFGATSAFENVSRVKAAIWFVVVPMAFYTLTIAGLALAVVLLTEQ